MPIRLQTILDMLSSLECVNTSQSLGPSRYYFYKLKFFYYLKQTFVLLSWIIIQNNSLLGCNTTGRVLDDIHETLSLMLSAGCNWVCGHTCL